MIYWAVFAAGVLHVVEEYFFPGGFMGMMKRFQPRYAPFVTVRFAVIINGLFLIVCLAGAIFHRRLVWLGLAIAALVGLNCLSHVAAAIRAKGYAPGVISAALLYAPLAVIAFKREISRGSVTLRAGLMAAILGMLLMAVPIVHLGLARLCQKC